MLSHVTENTYTVEHVKTVNDIIKRVTAWSEKILTYDKMNLFYLRITVFSDVSFSKNDDSSSEVEYIALLTDKYNKFNPM